MTVWWLSLAVRKGQQPPWMVADGLWERIEPLLPVVPRRADHPGRRRLDDRKVLCGILFVLNLPTCRSAGQRAPAGDRAVHLGLSSVYPLSGPRRRGIRAPAARAAAGQGSWGVKRLHLLMSCYGGLFGA